MERQFGDSERERAMVAMGEEKMEKWKRERRKEDGTVPVMEKRRICRKKMEDASSIGGNCFDGRGRICLQRNREKRSSNGGRKKECRRKQWMEVVMG